MQPSRVKAVLAIATVGLTLSGCVVYPSNGYYAAPAVYAPTVAVGVGYGWGWGGGWGRGGWR